VPPEFGRAPPSDGVSLKGNPESLVRARVRLAAQETRSNGREDSVMHTDAYPKLWMECLRRFECAARSGNSAYV